MGECMLRITSLFHGKTRSFLAALGAFRENHAGMKLQLVGLIINQEFNIEHVSNLPNRYLHVYIALFVKLCKSRRRELSFCYQKRKNSPVRICLEVEGANYCPPRSAVTLIKRQFYNYVMIRKQSHRARNFNNFNYQTKPQ